MAGALKPTGVKEEGTISLISSSLRLLNGVTGVTNNISNLLDGVYSSSSYGDALMWANGSNWIEFECKDKIKIWAIGTKTASDNGGIAGKSINVLKWDGTAYTQVEIRPTKNNSTWYELTSVLEPGKYKLTPTSNYVSMDEWYIELLWQEKVLFSASDNKIRNVEGSKITEIQGSEKSDFIDYGVSPSIIETLDLSVPFNKKGHVQKQSIVLGVGKVFEQLLDINKVVKKVSISE